MHAFIVNYPAFQYLVVFLGAAFGGEVAMITLAFLTAQGIFSFYPFLFISFCGTFSSDILWFLLGKTNAADRFLSHRYTKTPVSVIIEAVRRISKGSDFVALLLANFMLASRIILIMYVSKRNLSFIKFLYYEAFAVTLWLIAVISIGFVSGLGYTYLAEIFNNLYVATGFILLTMFAVIMVQVWLEKRFTKENS